MKNRSWRIVLILVLFFSLSYYGVSLRGDRGDLNNPDLIRLLYRPLTNFRGWFSDVKFKARGDRPLKNKIVIVSIDLDSIAHFGRWPWHRDLQAKIIEEIDGYKPRVIGMDLLPTEAEERVPIGLKQALEKKNLGLLTQKYETDPVLASAIEKASDHFVMGIVSQKDCQSTQSEEASGGSCPSFDEHYDHALKEGFGRFFIQQYKKPAQFDFTSSPLFISRYPVMNFDAFQKVARHIGFFEGSLDPDGVSRQLVLVKFANEFPLASFALEVARVARGEELAVELGNDSKISSLRFASSGEKIHVTPVGRMEINFRGDPMLIPHVSVVDLMNGEKTVPVRQETSFGSTLSCKTCKPLGRIRGKSFKGYEIDKEELFRDAIVMIGLTDVGNDTLSIPNYANAAGVEVHASVVDNLLSDDALESANNLKASWGLILLLTVGALIFGLAMDFLPSAPAILVFIFTLVIFALVDVKVLFDRGININSGFLYVEYALIGILVLFNRYIAEENQRKFIKRAFSRFVSPQVVKTILDDPKQLALSGTRRDLTVMFSDIRGFMPFSSTLEPQQLHQFLNDYHDTMTRIVIEKGTLDKYIGDAIMAFWGAPLPQEKHAFHACMAAIRMMEELRAHNVYFKEKYGEEISIGIGINSGPVIVGNMGSKEVFSYTIIGDDVNLASRVERLTRVYGVNIVVTGATIESIRASGETIPPYRVLDRLKVLGSDDAIDAIQILDATYPSEALASYEAGRQAYMAKKWDVAIEKFQEAFELIEIKLGFTDNPSIRMIERCQQFKAVPPPTDWDGVWQMTRK